MTWKYVRSSVMGTSHLKNASQCQDNCICEIVSNGEHNDSLVALVSDGAGSGKRSESGSKLACDTVLKKYKEYLIQNRRLEDISVSDIKNWISSAVEEINILAENEKLTVREFASTMIGAIISKDASVYFQVGDGAIVASSDGIQYDYIFWPEQGEYINTTYFITDHNFYEHLRFKKLDISPLDVALFSDGIEMLALKYAEKSVHSPFFEPMFKVVRKSGSNGFDEALSDKLSLFLNSKPVNDRTDDDKTLILATSFNADGIDCKLTNKDEK